MDITKAQQNDLLGILDRLIETINEILKIKQSYFLSKNLHEAEDWRSFLADHIDTEELDSLNNEIADRFVHEFEQQENWVLRDSSHVKKLDDRRIELMKEFMKRIAEYISAQKSE